MGLFSLPHVVHESFGFVFDNSGGDVLPAFSSQLIGPSVTVALARGGKQSNGHKGTS
jgi:hypothetical protein